MRLFIALVFSLCAFGCAFRSAPVSYFLLSASTTPASEAQQISSVRLQPIELADYLRRTALIQRQGSSVIISDDLQWAGMLEDEITRVTLSNLNALLGTPQVQPPLSGQARQNSLNLRIDRFDGTLNGDLRLDGAFSIIANSGELLGQQHFNIVTKVGGDIDSLIAAHNQALAELAALIVPLLPPA